METRTKKRPDFERPVIGRPVDNNLSGFQTLERSQTSDNRTSGRGRLVQWETVRLQIQRSEFDSRRNRWMFLSRPWQKNARCRFIRILFTLIGQRHLLDILESGLFSHCMKRNVTLKIGPMTSSVESDVIRIYYATLQKSILQPLHHQPIDLTYGGVRSDG